MKFMNIELVAVKLGETRDFYGTTLGLNVYDVGTEAFKIQMGSTSLGFRQASPGEKRSPYHFAMNITPQLLDSAQEWLEKRGLQVLTRTSDDGEIERQFDFPDWNARAVYFFDPDGNIVEFIARHNLASSSSGEFEGPKDILNVSEIGLPIDDPADFVEKLRQATGVDMWREPGESFKALGDEEGLCIVVKRRRPWYPTDLPADISPTRVTIAQSGQDFVYEPYSFVFMPEYSPS